MQKKVRKEREREREREREEEGSRKRDFFAIEKKDSFYHLRDVKMHQAAASVGWLVRSLSGTHAEISPMPFVDREIKTERVESHFTGDIELRSRRQLYGVFDSVARVSK